MRDRVRWRSFEENEAKEFADRHKNRKNDEAHSRPSIEQYEYHRYLQKVKANFQCKKIGCHFFFWPTFSESYVMMT